jgi:glutamate formiminotransferase
MSDAANSARRVGERIAKELRVPVYWYGAASVPPGRSLAALRRGGYEALVTGWPVDRRPDVVPEGWEHPGAHPQAGAVCVGARPVLLAWNVWVRGLTLQRAREIARALREDQSGISGLRALALPLPSRNALQISMNIEHVERSSPAAAFERAQQLVEAAGGAITQTEIIGMAPDELLDVATDAWHLQPGTHARSLSRHLQSYLAAHHGAAAKSE